MITTTIELPRPVLPEMAFVWARLDGLLQRLLASGQAPGPKADLERIGVLHVLDGSTAARIYWRIEDRGGDAGKVLARAMAAAVDISTMRRLLANPDTTAAVRGKCDREIPVRTADYDRFVALAERALAWGAR